MDKGKTVYLHGGSPLRVQSLEERPSESVIGLSGRKIDYRVGTTPQGEKEYIPENIIIRVEENS